MRDMFDEPQPKTLRPHQAKAIDLLRQSLGKGNRRVVVAMPTGAGKTVTAAEIIKGALAKGKNVTFTAPAVSLIDQTVSAFLAQGIADIGVMQANHPRTNAAAKVQVATVQTLARREMPESSLVIVDEAHIRSEVIDRMMAARPDVFFVGLSATPWRKGMGLIWQDLVVPVTIGEMIDAGLLSKFTVFAPDVPDLSGVAVSKGEYVEAGLQRVMGDAKILGSVVGNWLERGERRPTLCFCVNRAHAAQVQAEFKAHGISAAYVDGDTDSVERSLINAQFRRGEYAVICSVRTMTTGVDLPVSCIIDAAPTRSEMLHCLDSETEILTSDGWKGMGQIAEGDCVASCVGTNQSQGQWALVTGTIQRQMEPDESWVEYDSVHANFRVTGDHRMIFATGQRDMRFGTALEIAGKSDGAKVPSAVTIRQPGVPLSADELWLIGMFMADGTFNERSQQVSISQSERHPEIVARIDATLRRLGVSYRKSPVAAPKDGEMPERHSRWRWNMSVGAPKPKVGVGRFAPHPDSILFDGNRGLRWLMPWLEKDMALGLLAMSAEQFEAFLQGLWDGDGSKKKGADYTPRTQQILTVRKVLADRLQALGAVNGYTVNLRHYDPEGRARQYHLSFKRQDWRHVGGTGRKPCFKIGTATREDVWCVETTTGTIVTRRRGKVTVMGNCQKVGRGLRVNPGTEDCTIFDHAGNSLRLGLVTQIGHATLDCTPPGERAERKPVERLPKECPKCGVLRIGALCPACGHESAPPKLDEAHGELKRISGKVRLATRDEKQAFWSMALWVDHDRGKAGKLAKALYRGKFGVWPHGLDYRAVRPDAAFMDYDKSRRIAWAKKMEKQRNEGAA